MFRFAWFPLAVACLTILISALADDSPQWYLDQVALQPGGTHACNRACKEGDSMTCYYKFMVEKFYTMSKACYDCPRNLTDCYREDCISMDGLKRPVTTINRSIPGPSVEICLGDEIVIDVENMMLEEATTIHLHGHRQVGTPYMDGVPFITQCVISPETTFRYTMGAVNFGTHFWHSHTGLQRSEGMFGALIFRLPDVMNVHRHLYDQDLSEHVIIINDWTHNTSTMEKFIAHIEGSGNNYADAIIVNGRGRYYNDTERLTDTPLAVFKVQPGLRYRFRLINSGIMNCPVEMYIDKHNLTFISSDGFDFDPVTGDSLVSYVGERWDFVLNASNYADNYWIRFTGLEDCQFTRAHQVAVLHYEGAPEVEPEGQVGYGLHPKYTMQLNPLNTKNNKPYTISVDKLRSANKNPNLHPKDEILGKKIILPFDFYPVDNPLFHKHGVYGFHEVNATYQRYTPQLNHITFRWPPAPLLSQHEDIPQDYYCSEQNTINCETQYCECTNIIPIPLNTTVEIILVDTGKVFKTKVNHPFHMHGYGFRVVGMDHLGNDTTVDTIMRLDEQGDLVRNLQDPPFKDTITVPEGGYVILHLHNNNPGYWLFHCHIEFHLEYGMAVVFKVGEHEEFPPVPENFPKCGNFKKI